LPLFFLPPNEPDEVEVASASSVNLLKASMEKNWSSSVGWLCSMIRKVISQMHEEAITRGLRER
jgi:hypothetical protein